MVEDPAAARRRRRPRQDPSAARTTRTRKRTDEEADPDDVEADLDTILKDRIAAQPDEDEGDEDEQPEPDDRGDGTGRIQPKRPGEFVCQSCFLVKHPRQLADPRTRMLCVRLRLTEDRGRERRRRRAPMRPSLVGQGARRLFVYAPIGLFFDGPVAAARSSSPGTANHAKAARLFGQFAVRHGRGRAPAPPGLVRDSRPVGWLTLVRPA